ncbi:hypothetical protein SAMD00019534_051180 [Acytostelium subglobosum LB1]|uniref:hypothetical protein n=1 Tax=Acytostelium subglobosum LB1 TaxID=1410327 RepID=UPI000644F9A7|nr:hypothetical protein SAMD00019534_051180 [Acytostelium subglobosum LB1]GAM21943.1 hypothetical protein SAMD00019534_051180 [Acytostelium subglobosum LB1]|eukprot:XP_012755043.1 hypothetical protein SAMD00019534_051180 [Acytostelium subglobosum LB1]
MVIESNQRADVIVTALSTLSTLIKPCFGLNGTFQMMLPSHDDTNSNHNGGDQQQSADSITLTNKASEILKLVKLDHPISDIIKRTMTSLEYVAYDGGCQLVLLIERLSRDAMEMIEDRHIHPISLVYALQKLGKRIEPMLSSCRVSLLMNNNSDDGERLKPEDIDAMSSDQIKELIINVDPRLLYSTVHSSIYTKLKDQQQASEVADVVSGMMMAMYNKRTVSQQMRQRINFRDQVIITPIIQSSNKHFKSSFILNSFILDLDHHHHMTCKTSESMSIILINEPLEMDNSKGDGNSGKIADTTAISFTSSQHMNELLDKQKDITMSKIRRLRQLNVDVVISSCNIDDTSMKILSDDGGPINGRPMMVLRNVSKQLMGVISKGLDIKSLNSILHQTTNMVTNPNTGDDDSWQQSFKKHFVGRMKHATLLDINSNSLSSLKSNKVQFSGIISRDDGQLVEQPMMATVMLVATTPLTLRYKVGSFVTGCGVAKCCFEDLFILPGAQSVELSIAKQLRRQQQQNKEDSSGLDVFDIMANKLMARALESLSNILLLNSGSQTLHIDLLHQYNNNDDNDGKGINLDLRTRTTTPFIDPSHHGIYDTYRSKLFTMRNVIDVVCLLLKIDQIVYPRQTQPHQQSPPQQQSQSQQKQPNYIEFKPPPLNIQMAEQRQLEQTRKKNQMFYSKSEVERRQKLSSALLGT